MAKLHITYFKEQSLENMVFLKQISHSSWYWLFLLVSGLAMESAALYYQYVLDEWPCMICIHIRIWIAGFILLSVLALLFIHSTLLTRFFHFLNTLLMLGFVERSWQVLAVERGWTFSECTMDAGLPSWFAIDQWLPSIFGVKTSCGYTPLVIFNISMAEILMAISSVLLILSLSVLIAHWLPRRFDY